MARVAGGRSDPSGAFGENPSPRRVFRRSDRGKSHERDQAILCESQSTPDAFEKRSRAAVGAGVEPDHVDYGRSSGGGDIGTAIFICALVTAEAAGGLLAAARTYNNRTPTNSGLSSAGRFVDNTTLFRLPVRSLDGRKKAVEIWGED